LALEAGHALGVLRERLRQNLDRHIASELGIGGAVDGPHPALAELGRDVVMRDRLLWAHCERMQASYHFPATLGLLTHQLSQRGKNVRIARNRNVLLTDSKQDGRGQIGNGTEGAGPAEGPARGKPGKVEADRGGRAAEVERSAGAALGEEDGRSGRSRGGAWSEGPSLESADERKDRGEMPAGATQTGVP